MTVGIVGLGLIGGSFAKAYKARGHKVLAWNRSQWVLDYAMLGNDVDGVLDSENIGSCDLVLVTLYPQHSALYLEQMAPYIGEKPVVIDCCGTKRFICQKGFSLAREYGFCYVGGHPMAGTHKSGYKFSKADMFEGAPMVLVPERRDDIVFLDRLKKLLQPAGFGQISITNAEEHDELIAFTSQLAHVVSNAYIKSPTAQKHKGFSAGSYKDLTRVAWLNAPMWTELFMENRDNLIKEIDWIINSLNQYKTAMEQQDPDELCRLLEEGKQMKEQVDGQ